MRSVTAFAGSNLGSGVVGSTDYSQKEMEWADVAPDSNIETVVDIAYASAPNSAAT
jgi:hypothetical protein